MNVWLSWLSHAGVNLYIGLFILLVIEEAGVPFPLPGYAVMMYLGFRAHEGRIEGPPVLATAIVAVTIGSCLLYVVAHAAGRPLLTRLGRFGRSQASRIDTIERWFEQRGILVVVAGRLVPNLRNPTTLTAGFLRLPAHVFVPGTALAAIVWSVGYFYLGMMLGPPSAIVAGLLGMR